MRVLGYEDVGEAGLGRHVRLVRQDVLQAHECDQVEQVVRSVAELDPATLTSRGELEPRERIDGDCVRVDAVDVAAEIPAAALRQERADAVAQPGQVVPGDRAPDREVHEKRTAFIPRTHR